MDGQFYLDTRLPHIITDVAAVTLGSSHSALYPVANIAAMGKDYWTPGKAVRIEAWGRMTTGATPGNLTMALLYGTGANNNGTAVCATAATALAASQTNLTWRAVLDVHCTAIGSAGALFGMGQLEMHESLIAARLYMPASAPAAVGSLDLTVAGNVLSLQALRSGSTTETMQVHKLRVTSLN